MFLWYTINFSPRNNVNVGVELKSWKICAVRSNVKYRNWLRYIYRDLQSIYTCLRIIPYSYKGCVTSTAEGLKNCGKCVERTTTLHRRLVIVLHKEAVEVFRPQTGQGQAPVGWPPPSKLRSFKNLKTVPENCFVLVCQKTMHSWKLHYSRMYHCESRSCKILLNLLIFFKRVYVHPVLFPWLQACMVSLHARDKSCRSEVL